MLVQQIWHEYIGHFFNLEFITARMGLYIIVLALFALGTIEAYIVDFPEPSLQPQPSIIASVNKRLLSVYGGTLS